MKLCEILLMSIILVLGIVVIVTDFHAGVIKNKVLFSGYRILGVIINFDLHYLFCEIFACIFIKLVCCFVNISVIICFSLLGSRR